MILETLLDSFLMAKGIVKDQTKYSYGSQVFLKLFYQEEEQQYQIKKVQEREWESKLRSKWILYGLLGH